VRRLVEALRLLAASVEAQRSALPDFVCITDEVALTFDDEYRVNASAIAELAPALQGALANINGELDAMSARPELWTVDSLGAEPEWERIRAQARAVLTELGEDVRPPDLFWLTFVGR